MTLLHPKTPLLQEPGVPKTNENFQTLRKREQKEKFFFPLSKIESRKRNECIHFSKSRKSRSEREIKICIFRDRERNFFFYSRFFSQDRDSCQYLASIMNGRLAIIMAESFTASMQLDLCSIESMDTALKLLTKLIGKKSPKPNLMICRVEHFVGLPRKLI